MADIDKLVGSESRLELGQKINEIIDTTVLKTGDTMTGTLKLTNTDIINSGQLRLENKVGVVLRNDGSGFYILLTDANNEAGAYNSLRPFWIDFATGFPCTTNPDASNNANNLATTAFVKQVLATTGNGLADIYKTSTGACKFSNGLIINWGRTSVNASTTATATFKTPFTSTNYKVVLGLYHNDAGSQKNYTTYTYTTTNFVIYNGQASKVNYDWLAIGY